MPLPPSENNGEVDKVEEPKLQFSYVECLMFSFHQIARFQDDFFTTDAAVAKLKDFRMR